MAANSKAQAQPRAQTKLNQDAMERAAGHTEEIDALATPTVNTLEFPARSMKTVSGPESEAAK